MEHKHEWQATLNGDGVDLYSCECGDDIVIVPPDNDYGKEGAYLILRHTGEDNEEVLFEATSQEEADKWSEDYMAKINSEV